MQPDWYERRHELMPDQIFRTMQGDVVRLERGVSGDGTRWHVLDWCKSPYDGRGYWSQNDGTIEPGDLSERLSDNWKG
jgi:hypothetical protein